MLNLPQQTLNKIKELLLKQQKRVETEIKSLEKEDPVMADSVAESTEPGTESFLADVHNRLTAVRNNLTEMSKKIQKSLLRIKQGTYGKCDRCGKQIETARLEAMPTANLCMSCSKKTSR